MKPLKLKSKAETLEQLQGKLSKSNVLPQVVFSTEQWGSQRQSVLKAINEKTWAKNKLCVRSSALVEDSAESSMAGHFDSILNCSLLEIPASIEKVIASYEDKSPNNLIFIQPMVENVRMSGVAFSCLPGTGDPYYTIEYENSGDTAAVTSGASSSTKLFRIYRNAKVIVPSEIRAVLDAIQELELIFESQKLDIEFAVNESGVWILQVRQLVIAKQAVNSEKTEELLFQVEKHFEAATSRHPYLLGNSPIYGVMPDWNPAEIIGIRPKPLAMSLYRELVTDTIWSYQRSNYGYRNLRSFPLMISFGGIPFIDVRVSFNSFVPSDLREDIAEKLVNYYTKKLSKYPQFHDKVEFEIVISSYCFDIESRLQELRANGFTVEEVYEIREKVLSITNAMLKPNSLWMRDLDKINTLEKRRESILNSDLDVIQKIFWLVEDCKRYGTLPFAGIARAAFVAVRMLKSMTRMGILSDAEYNEFLFSLETVSKRLSIDKKRLSRSEFLKLYGHLRPGTYDIESKRYDEDPEGYFPEGLSEENSETSHEELKLSLTKLQKMESSIKAHGLQTDPMNMLAFMKSTIEGREYGKFVFSRSISDTLKLVGELGAENGLSRSDCAFLSFDVLKRSVMETRTLSNLWADSIEKGKRAHQYAQRLHFPPIIQSTQDIWAFHLPDVEPNYISMSEVTGEVVVISDMKCDIAGKIVFIESADPGYDWIFAHGIKGLVTQFGGANSHMAIRAAELGVTAVIGCGPQRFEKWGAAKVLHIDARNEQVQIIR